MPLDEIQRLSYNDDLQEDIKKAIKDFQVYKGKLQVIFDLLQEYIDNPNTEPNHATILIARKGQGKIIIQNMLDGIT